MTKVLTLEDGKQKIIDIDAGGVMMMIVCYDANECVIEADRLLGCDLEFLGGVEDC